GNVIAMVQLAQAHGAPALVVGPVYRDRTTNPPEAARIGIYRMTLGAAMRERRIPYLQIDELTEDGAPHNDFLFGEHVHPNSLGHQLMAERVQAALREHGLLRELADRDVVL